jgi:hypothetical protein
MATNVLFNYLYRDSSNYKKFGHKNYFNPENRTLEEAEQQLRKQLISTEFFMNLRGTSSKTLSRLRGAGAVRALANWLSG